MEERGVAEVSPQGFRADRIVGDQDQIGPRRQAARHRGVVLSLIVAVEDDLRVGSTGLDGGEGYLLPKLRRNKERDKEKETLLNQLGWGVLTVWECELDEIGPTLEKVTRFLDI